MAYVVTEPCIKCKYTECLQACPVICFHEGQNFLVIDPDDCIDCGACVDPCPVKAIYPESEVPAKWRSYVELNKKYARLWPVITMQKKALETAEEFSTVEEKGQYFESTAGSGDAG